MRVKIADLKIPGAEEHYITLSMVSIVTDGLKEKITITADNQVIRGAAYAHAAARLDHKFIQAEVTK